MLRTVIVYLLYLAGAGFTGTVHIGFADGRWVSIHREESTEPKPPETG